MNPTHTESKKSPALARLFEQARELLPSANGSNEARRQLDRTFDAIEAEVDALVAALAEKDPWRQLR